MQPPPVACLLVLAVRSIKVYDASHDSLRIFCQLLDRYSCSLHYVLSCFDQDGMMLSAASLEQNEISVVSTRGAGLEPCDLHSERLLSAYKPTRLHW